MKNKFKKIIKKLLTKSFIIFVFIGIINTLIDYVIYYYFFEKLFLSIFIAKTIAFLTASIFSYFANAKYTYKVKEKNIIQFSLVMLSFLSKWGLSVIFTYMFDFIINSLGYSNYASLSTLFASITLIPFTFLVLDVVFKKTQKKDE